MITYNHENYIQQAIDSILMQKTDFHWKLYIGEDCSTDRTREICKSYQKEFPEQIILLPPKKNIGAIPNFKRTIEACPGQYVAILEGDDYWCDVNKLQKQINFLEDQPDLSGCYTNIHWLYPDGSLKAVHTGKKNQNKIGVEDMLERNYVATLTCVFRNNLFSIPSWLDTLYLGDWPLNIINSLYGNIGHIEDYTGVYRVHNTGIWSPLKEVQKEEHLIKMFERIREVLPYQYQAKIKNVLKKKYYFLSLEHKKHQDKEKSDLYYKKYWKETNSLFDKGFYKLTTKKYLLS